jgi:hypothetical protein
MPKTGNITGESFDIEVTKQINARQTFLGARNRTDSQILYANNKTAFLRLASSIRIEDNLTNPNDPIYAVDILKQRGISSTLTGDELAKACILFGGVASINTTNSSVDFNFGLNQNANFPGSSQLTGAYGWGGIINEKQEGRGYVPMPGIDSANISFVNRGAIAKADVTLKVFSIEQLQIFDLLYFRIGYTMLLEWGHNLYINNDISPNSGKPDPKLVERKQFYTKPFDTFFSTQKSTQNDIITAIKEQRKNDNYNYDAMLGKVTNFSWKFNSDGSYDITLNLVGLGDIVEALKINTANTKDPKVLPPSILAQREAEALAKAEEALNKEREKVAKNRENANLQSNEADQDKQTTINNAQASFNTTKASISSFDATQFGTGLTTINGLTFADDSVSAKANVRIIDNALASISSTSVETSAQDSKTRLIGLVNKLKTAQNKVVNLGSTTKKQSEAQKAISQADTDDASIEAKERALEAAQKAYNKKQAEAALSGNTTEENRNKTYFNNQLYNWKQAAITKAGASYDSNNLFQLNFKSRSENSVETGGKNLSVNFYYVRLGYVLDWVEKNLLVYDSSPSGPNSTNNKTPIFKIDTTVENNYCLSFPTQVSTDPQICVISSKYTSPTTASLSWDVLPNLPAQYSVEDNPNAGRLMNIFVNIDFIAKVLEGGVDANGKTNLLKFLNDMFTGINDALGNVNKLEAIYDDESISLKIIEESNIKGIKSEDKEKENKIAVFKSYGIGTPTEPLGSFLTNVDFQVQLPPNMAAMATISAQSSGNIVGENATALSKLNKGLVDRIITKKLDAASIEGAQTGNESPANKFDKNLEYLSKQIQDIYTNKNYSPDTIESIKSVNRDIALYLTGEDALSSTPQNKKPSPFFIPFNLSLEMDGLSGMVNYERFAISVDILPYSYRSGDQGGVIDFLIKGVSHTVSGNQWKTKIESISVSSARNNV